MSRSLVKFLFGSAAISFAGMTAFQGVKHLLIPGINIQDSHHITNLFIVAVSTLAVYFVIRIVDRKKLAVYHETAERKRLEAKLDQVNQEFSNQVQDQTSELTRLNFELELEMVEHKRAREILRANEERFRNMADNIQEGLTIIENGKVVYANHSACEIFGCSPEEQLKFSSIEYAAPEEKERIREILEKAALSGSPPDELKYWILRKDGTKRCVHDRYSYSHKDGVLRSFIITSDITERVQAYQMLEQAVEERTRELSTVLEVSQKIASTLELKPLLRLVLDQIKSVIPYSGSAIFTLEEDTLTVMIYKLFDFPGSTKRLHLSLSNAGACQEVIRTRSALIIDDVHGDSPLARAFQESTAQPELNPFVHARSWLGVPLVVKNRVIGLLSLTHSQPYYYTQRHAGLATTIANQVAVAMENARLYEQAQHLATVEERQRIARELHDSVTQILYGICLYSSAASRSIHHADLQEIARDLSEIKSNALQALKEMRLLIFEMHPPMLKEEGLVAALHTSLEAVEARTGLQTELKSDGVSRLPSLIEGELFRIAMEALKNLVKYAKAEKVIVDLRMEDGRVSMEICDNGVGFNLVDGKACGGLGLRGMEERAKRVGGSLEIESTPGRGTRVSVRIPVHGNGAKPEEAVSFLNA